MDVIRDIQQQPHAHRPEPDVQAAIAGVSMPKFMGGMDWYSSRHTDAEASAVSKFLALLLQTCGQSDS